MNTSSVSFDSAAVVLAGLGAAAAVIVGAALTGQKLPLVGSDRAAFFALAIVGFAMCSAGMGRVATTLGWVHPITVLGMALGVLAMLLIAAVLFRFPLPLIATDRAALIALAAIMLVKVGLDLARRLLA